MVKVVRIPEERYGRLREMAKRRGVSVSQLIKELTMSTQPEHETKRQFRVRAARGSVKKGLEVLDKLDRAFAKGDK